MFQILYRKRIFVDTVSTNKTYAVDTVSTNKNYAVDTVSTTVGGPTKGLGTAHQVPLNHL